MSINKTELNDFIRKHTKNDRLYFYKEGVVGRTTLGHQDAAINVQQGVQRLAIFLADLGYALVYKGNGKKRVLHCIRSWNFLNPKSLPLQVAVSLYNGGGYSPTSSVDRVVTVRTYRTQNYVLCFPPAILLKAHANKQDSRPLTLQRCRGGLKV